ncbi:hypothetical protein ILUMI_09941 [Ignelater luminosus]|uniref:Uncharacterized protein n=1 Tax=Ignelater luminosus TaxID=2038154 RepID=A0A8K0G960_IGNLU|nr:hypothetical protein ILUMI_09941 [Ignelater luminosus]
MFKSIGKTNMERNIPWSVPLDIEKGDCAQNFEDFVLAWKDYETATGMNKWSIEEMKRQMIMFLTAIGSKPLIKFNRFQLTDKNQTDVNTAIEVIRKRLGSQKNVIYDRAMFNSCNQVVDETFDEYFLKLQKPEVKCEFENFENDLLRDRVILGIKNKDLTKRMMSKTDLTLENAIDICKVKKLTTKRLEDIKEDNTVNKIQTDKKQPRKCFFCGKQHEFKKRIWPAWGGKCSFCSGYNNFEIVCKKKNNKATRKSTETKKKCDRRVKEVTEKKFKQYGGTNIPVCGEVYLRCLHNDKSYGIKFVVVDVNHGPLLSAKAYKHLELIKFCNLIDSSKADVYIKEAQDLVKKYNNVFKGYGTISGEVKLEINSEIKPVIQTAKRIPVSLKKDLKQELDKVVKDDVVKKEDKHTNWVKITNLRKLTHNVAEWIWAEIEEKEFSKIIEIVQDIKTLKYYNSNETLIMECDLSSYGLGVALFQTNGVIRCASRTLTKAEEKFAEIEKELLSIVFECVKFDQIIVDNKVIVKTDHKPLLTIFKKPLLNAPKRLQNMLMILQRYNIEIQYISGKENIVADTLSRAPLHTSFQTKEQKNAPIYKTIENTNIIKYLQVTTQRMKSIKEETAKDSALQNIKKYIIRISILAIRLIENCNSAVKAIEKLDGVYKQTTEFNKMALLEKFHNLNMKKEDSVIQYITIVENLAHELKDAGENISETAIITKMAFGVFDKNVNKKSELNGFNLDGGASFHMTYRKDFLHDFQELNDSVTLGDNSVLKVTGKDKIEVRRLIKNQWTDAVINEVFYIPELKQNLLSEGVLTGKGMKIVKIQESGRIFYNDELVGVALKGENNIYHLQMEPLVNQRVPNVVDDIQMSHVDKKHFCTGCIVGKQHKSSFKSCEKRKTKAGGLIHCDVGGPLPQPSIYEEEETECVKQETPNIEPTEKEDNEAETVQPVEEQVLEENILNEEDDNNYEVVRKRRISKMPAKYRDYVLDLTMILNDLPPNKSPKSFKEAV